MGSLRVIVTTNIRFGLLCRWNDACRDESLWYGSFWDDFSRFPPPCWFDYCCWNINEQDGANFTTIIWTNPRPTLNSVYGKLCQWRRLLPLFLFRNPRLRSCSSCWHLRTWLSTNRRSVALWPNSTPRENWVCVVRIEYFERMVRRWSYLTRTTSASRFRGKLHRYAFKLIRRVTRFKRFTFGITKFKRRAWFRLKSRQTWFKLHVAIVGGLELRKQIQSLLRCQFYRFIMTSEKDIFVNNWYRMARGIRFSAQTLSFISLRIRKTICIVNNVRGGLQSRPNHHELWYLVSLAPTLTSPSSIEATIRDVAFNNAKGGYSGWGSEMGELMQLIILYQMLLLQDTYILLSSCSVLRRP